MGHSCRVLPGHRRSVTGVAAISGFVEYSVAASVPFEASLRTFCWDRSLLEAIAELHLGADFDDRHTNEKNWTMGPPVEVYQVRCVHHFFLYIINGNPK